MPKGDVGIAASYTRWPRISVARQMRECQRCGQLSGKFGAPWRLAFHQKTGQQPKVTEVLDDELLVQN